jgi:hypothetical protein
VAAQARRLRLIAFDPGVTAQLECPLDEVVIGRQEMVGAIDAVCDVAQRIIGKLKAGASAGGPRLLGAAVGGDAEESQPPEDCPVRHFLIQSCKEKAYEHAE